MTGALLVLDGSSLAAAAIAYMGEALEREVVLVESVPEATAELDGNPGKYAALLTEPFMYFSRTEQLAQYQQFLEATRTQRGIPVVVFSTQPQSTIRMDFGLEEKKHYDAYSPKLSRHSPAEALQRTLESLLPA